MSLRLSPKHGLNPMVTRCFFCNEEIGIALLGLVKEKNSWGRAVRGSDVEAPRSGVIDREPCDTCKGYMGQGIILISVRDGEEGDNPYRTGGWVVVTEDAVTRMLQCGDGADPAQVEGNAALLADVVRRRVCFIPDEVWLIFGLPHPTTASAEEPIMQQQESP